LCEPAERHVPHRELLDLHTDRRTPSCAVETDTMPIDIAVQGRCEDTLAVIALNGEIDADCCAVLTIDHGAGGSDLPNGDHRLPPRRGPELRPWRDRSSAARGHSPPQRHCRRQRSVAASQRTRSMLGLACRDLPPPPRMGGVDGQKWPIKEEVWPVWSGSGGWVRGLLPVSGAQVGQGSISHCLENEVRPNAFDVIWSDCAARSFGLVIHAKCVGTWTPIGHGSPRHTGAGRCGAQSSASLVVCGLRADQRSVKFGLRGRIAR